MDTEKPFSRYAGIVDGVTEAYFRYDQEEAEKIMTAKSRSTSSVPTGPSEGESFAEVKLVTLPDAVDLQRD